MNTTQAVLLALLGGGGFVALVGAIASRRKTKAETADVVVQAAERILGNYVADNEQLREKVESLESENRDLKRQLDIMREQLRRMAHALRRAGVDPDLAGEGEW